MVGVIKFESLIHRAEPFEQFLSLYFRGGLLDDYDDVSCKTVEMGSSKFFFFLSFTK